MVGLRSESDAGAVKSPMETVPGVRQYAVCVRVRVCVPLISSACTERERETRVGGLGMHNLGLKGENVVERVCHLD